MWASAVVIFLQVQVIPAGNLRACIVSVSGVCEQICKENCSGNENTIQLCSSCDKCKLASGSIRWEDGMFANQLNKATTACVDDDSYKIDLQNVLRSIKPEAPTKDIAAAVQKCEEVVAAFCVDSNMCTIYCEKTKKCASAECTAEKRCKAKAFRFEGEAENNAGGWVKQHSYEGKKWKRNYDEENRVHALTREDAEEERRKVHGKRWGEFSENQALDIQTSSQLMQCIAEERESKAKGRGVKFLSFTGRREGRWQFIQTQELHDVGVFTDAYKADLKQRVGSPTEADKQMQID